MNICVTHTPFNPGNALNGFSQSCSDAGAIASFLGRVRGENDLVTTLSLEHYPGVTEAGIFKTAAEAKRRFSLSALSIVHRYGDMSVGDPIVLVMCAAKHRRDAFLACDFLMDYLKTEAIFWKKQYGKDGAIWIEPRANDYEDAKRWRPE